MVDITPLLTRHAFPMDVFPENIAHSFKQLAEHYSLPLDFMGTTALYTIAGLGGNMYTTELNGQIKLIVYAMLVGPSGVGKSPPYDKLCGDIVAPLEAYQYDQYRYAITKWNTDKDIAKSSRQPHEDPKPIRPIRTAKGGTVEGFMKHSESSPAGMALYYDEGGKMLNSPNAFKKDTGSTDFWNETWNGKSYNELRANSELERFASNTSISVLAGMQTDRISKYFNSEAFVSGLPQRFLLTKSDYIPLNENIDHFDTNKREVCPEWAEIVKALFNRGLLYTKKNTTIIKFTNAAKNAYNQLSSKLLRESNANRAAIRAGDVSQTMAQYDSKLQQYVGRFMMILAIIDDCYAPTITVDHIHNAERLYRFYRKQAEHIFTALNAEDQTQLTSNEIKLLDNLPNQFTSKEAAQICEALKMSDRFFQVAFPRKLSKGWIKKTGPGQYQKIID